VAPWIIRLFGDPGGDRQLAIGLSRVLFPIVLLLGVSGIVVGILNSYERFSVPALSPVFWNVAIIVGLVIGVPRADTIDGKLYVYAASIVIGTVIQVLLPMPWLRGLDGRLRVLIDWRDPAVSRVLKLMLPVTLGLGLINFNAVVDSIFASRLIDPELAPTAIDRAFRLYMLPQGIFSVAITTVLFPSLARLAARGDQVGFRSTLALGVRQIGFLLIPASVVSAVLAEPITRLVYQRGAFEPFQTPVVAGALAAFSAGLFFNGMMLLLNRGFFSLQSNWIPTAVALGNLGLNAVLDTAFYRFGTWGIPLATSLVNVAGSVVLIVLMRRRLGRLGFREIADSLLRIVIASAVLAGVAYGSWYGLDRGLGRSFVGQLVSVGGALAVGVAVYLLSCRALKVRELGALLALLSRFKARLT
jgi:putative peptidoglycan lipid II flippase